MVLDLLLGDLPYLMKECGSSLFVVLAVKCDAHLLLMVGFQTAEYRHNTLQLLLVGGLWDEAGVLDNLLYLFLVGAFVCGSAVCLGFDPFTVVG